MVYTALQLISRGREAGLSVIDLGKKTGYDQKTCFYLVLQLLSLDLVYGLLMLSILGPTLIAGLIHLQC
jgi:oxalate---CoA ligase